jgi:hypothetical protein
VCLTASAGAYDYIYSAVEVGRFQGVRGTFGGLLFLRSSNKEVMLVTTS